MQLDFARVRFTHGVVEFVDAQSSAGTEASQDIHGNPHILLKRKQLRIGHFQPFSQTALGAGGRVFESRRPDQWNHRDAGLSGLAFLLGVDGAVVFWWLV